MLTTTSGMLLLFARTAVVSGSEAQEHIIDSNKDECAKIRMSRKTLEQIRKVPIRYDPTRRSGYVSTHYEYYPVETDTEVVQTALNEWMSLLQRKQSSGGKDEIGWNCFVQDVEVGVVHAKEKLETQFDKPAVWRREEEEGEQSKYLNLLFVREIHQNLYEWQEASATDLSQKGQFKQFRFTRIQYVNIDGIGFMFENIGEKRLEDISGIYAEERRKVELSVVRYPIIPRPRQDSSIAIQRDRMEAINIRAAVAQESTRWQAVINKRLRDERAVAESRIEVFERHVQGWTQGLRQKTEEWAQGLLQAERERDESQKRQFAQEKKSLEDSNDQFQSEIMSLRSRITVTQQQLDSERVRHTEQLNERDEDVQQEASKRQQAEFDADQRIHQREEEIDHWIMMSMFIGGGVLTVLGLTIFVAVQRGYNEMSDDMEYELNAQLKRVKEPHPLVPEYPSAHANRLGVHEHPAVRDVFGMKEPWDVTPGEGFHVSRITKGGRTPRTTRGEGVDEPAGVSGVPVNEGQSECDVVEDQQEQMAEFAENFDI